MKLKKNPLEQMYQVTLPVPELKNRAMDLKTDSQSELRIREQEGQR